MSISQLQIFNLSYPFVDLAQEIDVATLEELRRIAERLIEEPNANFEALIRQVSDEQSTRFVSEAQSLTEERLATAYLIGLTAFDDEVNEMLDNPRNQGNSLPNPLFDEKVIAFGAVSEVARQKLKDYPQHQELYSQYEAGFKERISRFKGPYMRSSVQKYRNLAGEAIKPAFINGDTATRIDLSQRILNDFADKGIETISFPSGHRMSVEAFAEREARSYMNNVSMQGNVARATERGYNLVRISQYAGASPMCAPHQGNVYSLNDSDKYPPFSEALFDGTYNYGSGIRHDYSYIKDMETYTDKGWKLIKDLTGSEQIMSLNPDTLEPEWSGIERLHNYHHKGKMIHLKGHAFDLCVTPDHDLFIGYSGREGKKRVLKYKFEKAEKAIERAKFSQLRIPEWTGKSQKVPVNGVNESDFARLLAWFISDGYCEKPNGKYTKMCIRKSKEPHVSDMRRTLEPLGFKHGNGRFWIYQHEWAEYFSQFGKSYEKFLPEWIKENRPDIISIFLDAYIIGDGTNTKSTFDGYDVERVVYSTTSKRLADDLGECIIKAGYYPSFRLIETKGVPVEHHNGTYEGNHDLWHISRNKSRNSYYCNSPSNKDSGMQAELIDYDDRCYCVTLEKNHVLWVRRNGKTTWSGNCGHTTSSYIPGVSEGLGPLSNDPTERRILNEMGEAKGNRFIFDAEQNQRKIERQIRMYKRRKSVALTEGEKQRAEKLVRNWQARQREWIEKHPFLRRQYKREQI